MRYSPVIVVAVWGIVLVRKCVGGIPCPSLYNVLVNVSFPLDTTFRPITFTHHGRAEEY